MLAATKSIRIEVISLFEVLDKAKSTSSENKSSFQEFF
jgi:hypothetical protein